MSLVVDKVALPPSSTYRLHVLATRYRDTGESRTSADHEDGYTMICLHAVGLHKETWEVTIRRLLTTGTGIKERKGGRAIRIKEVYAIECPNHGESALLNKEILREHYRDTWTIREYTRAVHSFLTAGAARGACVDFSKRRLIGVGHCFGALALLFMHEMTPRIHFESFILFEPGIVPNAEYPDYREVFERYQAWVWLRREIWPSRKAAMKELSSKAFFKGWDKDIMRLFIEHAISEHPAAKYPPPYTFKGVILSTSNENETASYRSPEFVGDSLQGYAATTKETPVHLTWGEIDDVLPRHLKKNVTNYTSVASVSWVPDVGHLIIQQKPDLVAHRIRSCLGYLNACPMKASL